MFASKFTRTALATSLGVALLGPAAFVRLPGQADTEGFIVQGGDLAAVKTAVRAVGGEITHELGIIEAVVARLSEEQREKLRRQGFEKLFRDGPVAVSAASSTGTVCQL